MNKLLNTAIGMGLAVLALTANTAPSYAGTVKDHQQSVATVRFADLNTASPEGAQTLLRRINMAAAQTCGYRPDIREIRQTGLYQDCMAKAVKGAVAQANIPALSALYFGTGKVEVANR